MKGENANAQLSVSLSLTANHFRSTFLLTILFFSLSLTAFAQDDSPDTVPPPSRVISKEERSKLEAQREIKDRTRLALELMEARMKLAESALDREDFDSVHRELGGFQFLMDDALDYLNRRNNDSGSIRSNFKRYEITIRAFTPRLELIRREVPTRYEPYIFTLLKYLRDARTKAIEPQFGDPATN